MLREGEAWSLPAYPEVVLYPRGQVPILEAERIAGAVGRVLDRFHVPRTARVRLSCANCATGPMLVQVNTCAEGMPIRMQTTTVGRSDVFPAVMRLERQIAVASQPWHPPRWPDVTRRPLSLALGAEVVRRKQTALATTEPLTAARTMDALDYDAHLFTDAETGEDAVVYRCGPTGVRLARQHDVRPPDHADFTALTIRSTPAPTLHETDASTRVCQFGLPFLFYTDSDTGRGQLLYRRYDGDLTLLTPAVTSTQA